MLEVLRQKFFSISSPLKLGSQLLGLYLGQRLSALNCNARQDDTLNVSRVASFFVLKSLEGKLRSLDCFLYLADNMSVGFPAASHEHIF